MMGFFNVDKPQGPTSHDVVQQIRTLTGVRKVGHAGTLDPLATGVLIILVGRATRLARFVTGLRKRYRAVVRLGEITPTYDAESDVMVRRPVDVKRSEVAAALEQFRGEITQLPPIYSAIKMQGKPLYKLAREGKQVKPKPRQVAIYTLEMSAWIPPDVLLDVSCSSGTYIRSLAYDLGEALGCGAHLRDLTRLSVGAFRLEESYRLSSLKALAREDRLKTALRPPREALTFPAVSLNSEQTAYAFHGRVLTLPDAPQVERLQAHDPEGRLVAVLIPLEGNDWRPELVLHRT
jgi:tRNA pseudouridine55 synthase